MLKLIRTIAGDDIAVKVLFDHVRNVGICGVVFAAALWRYNNIVSGVEYVLDLLITFFLIALGVFLLLVNLFHGIETLKKAGHPSWVLHVVMQSYSLVVITLIFSILGIRM